MQQRYVIKNTPHIDFIKGRDNQLTALQLHIYMVALERNRFFVMTITKKGYSLMTSVSMRRFPALGDDIFVIYY